MAVSWGRSRGQEWRSWVLPVAVLAVIVIGAATWWLSRSSDPDASEAAWCEQVAQARTPLAEGDIDAWSSLAAEVPDELRADAELLVAAVGALGSRPVDPEQLLTDLTDEMSDMGSALPRLQGQVLETCKTELPAPTLIG